MQPSQEFLRSRVASVTIEDVDDAIDATYNHGTHYSYDVHGNVKELVQENKNLAYINHKYKKVNYTYDLISGKVNQVAYQPGQIDMFLHRYEYDADNRITNVYTSKDNVIWSQDAKYFYYKHGPLARTEIGHDKVQASDYAYTLQGWIKGVNSNILNPNNDMGKDGIGSLSNPSSGGTASQVINKFNAQDAFGYSLTYFNNATNKDYLAINATTGTANDFVATVSAGTAQSPDLYNGNIRQMVTSYLDANAPSKTYNPTSLLKNYTYDQLNRIETANSNDNLIFASNTWGATPTFADMYKETFRYDQNGNILNATRKGNTTTASVLMDDLTYNYIAGTNKLDNVVDAAGQPLGNDFKGGQTPGNYTYDPIGNLTADVSEGITNIDWTVYGKIKTITKASGMVMTFNYDASGNRISKKVAIGPIQHGGPSTTYYVRDAQGNVMATYEEHGDQLDIPQLYLGEQHLYGSSRLGLVNNNIKLTPTTPVLNTTLLSKVLGNKSFEFGNHLSNVILVVSDRKIGAWTSGITLDHFSSEIRTANDYYCFGFEIKGRAVNAGSAYPMGFNGKRNDLETGFQDYGLRIYNRMLGKFLSVDPLANKFPWWSPYAFAGNTPIQAIDLDGGEILNYKTPFRLRMGKEGLSNSREIAASYSNDLFESTSMLATATEISHGLAGKDYNMSMPLVIPLKPGNGENQVYFTITPDEQQQLDFFGLDNPDPSASDASSNSTDGSAGDRKSGEKLITTNRNKTVNDRAAAGAVAIQWLATKAFKNSRTMGSIESKTDLNNIIRAYADATTIVETFYDFSGVGKQNNWTDKQVVQYKLDIINFVADGKLPNGQTTEYNKSVQANGQAIINNVKEADAQKALLSD